jgi:hypothetical protein
VFAQQKRSCKKSSNSNVASCTLALRTYAFLHSLHESLADVGHACIMLEKQWQTAKSASG